MSVSTADTGHWKSGLRPPADRVGHESESDSRAAAFHPSQSGVAAGLALQCRASSSQPELPIPLCLSGVPTVLFELSWPHKWYLNDLLRPGRQRRRGCLGPGPVQLEVRTWARACLGQAWSRHGRARAMLSDHPAADARLRLRTR